MSGKYILAGALLLLFLLVAVVNAQGSGSVTRGRTFTVTVIGNARTAYDVWPKGTYDMTGVPGDQPPTIVAGQVDVTQDPPDGPYLIGSTPIGGGGTILDDIPPSTLEVPSTSYYAQVRTDASGYGVVLFQTSSATAIRQFHITAVNPANPAEDVGVVLGVPTQAPTPMIPLPLPTTRQSPLFPTPTTGAVTTTVPSTPVVTPVPVQSLSPGEPQVPTTPVQKIPLPDGVGIAAAGIGLLWASRVREE